MKDILLVNPPSSFSTYKDTRVAVCFQAYPVLSLAYLAAMLKSRGFSVSILDLGIEDNPFQVSGIYYINSTSFYGWYFLYIFWDFYLVHKFGRDDQFPKIKPIKDLNWGTIDLFLIADFSCNRYFLCYNIAILDL